MAGLRSIGGAAQGAGKINELRNRILFLLGALLVFRVGAHIPVPGIDPAAMATFFNQQRGTILGMFNMFSGGALSRLTVFALGIMPYISASIIFQLAGSVFPKLEELKKEGEAGRRKITEYTRYATVVLALMQGLGIAIAIEKMHAGNVPVVISPGPLFLFTTTISLACGTVFLMWIGEQITERGIGNGISMIIFAGIVAGLPDAIGTTFELMKTGQFQPLFVVALFVLALAVTGFVVFMESAQRRIPIQYAKRQVGRKVYGGQSTHMPLKVNMSGVIPPIFASSIILLPATLSGWFANVPGMEWLARFGQALSPGSALYVVVFTTAIVFFAFFYTAMVFNPRETADNLKKSGAFVPGIRPGEHTAKYMDRILTRLTLWGAIYLTLVCLLPEFLIVQYNVPFYFGGTSLLIVVVVMMDLMGQIQSHLLTHQYEGLIRKNPLGGR
ncbi:MULTISPECIES: preprotein translocase subunit SecY [Acidithiobacillus]|jgi:preprotein translocase subunit SecY|uniref:Protein translocase subunit SecY n=2 Tax=Acidithiobacillus ferridurans TaxID=1232575 RepID=A0A8X8G8C9_ACIFI|nr:MULTISPECIES: preprotein translocase subunit SecY [Acidithiobacillus]MCL4525672.1 preprotein translocase subunit SecY [Gammaproteobacteria bacterium]MBU2715458.1 preprotein translocase subunit SecY [Acidithiobacillus ferridurans]MBU2717971.1 preprotein translocase subunit SecY [Acidithiobacillus ferridurans]MBU2722308.1 preprotein translocase subunit SecY [Acidithiobacillus ferridurans]MBU2727597.1 preprotein translocase subunit SecY [Acidithiobacillus ferridurans]